MMDLSLSKNYSYILAQSVENVRDKIRAITRSSNYDHDAGLSGRIEPDNSFLLEAKYEMGIAVINRMNNLAHLSGQLKQDGEQTRIVLRSGPSILILICLYFVLLLALYFLISFLTLDREKNSNWPIAAGLFLVFLFFRFLIIGARKRMKNRFEKIMGIRPER